MSARCSRLYKGGPPPDERECDTCGAPAGAWVHRHKEDQSRWEEAEKCTSQKRGWVYPALVKIIKTGQFTGICTSCVGVALTKIRMAS